MQCLVAKAFGIPARLLRLSDRESLFKYEDYYKGSGRPVFSPTTSVAEGLSLGGEPPSIFNAQALLDTLSRGVMENAFAGDLWKAWFGATGRAP